MLTCQSPPETPLTSADTRGAAITIAACMVMLFSIKRSFLCALAQLLLGRMGSITPGLFMPVGCTALIVQAAAKQQLAQAVHKPRKHCSQTSWGHRLAVSLKPTR